MSSSEATVFKNDDLVTRRVAGQTIIVPIRGRVGDLSSIFTLNEVAGRVWELVDGRRSLGELAAAVAGEYDVGEAEAASDVRELVRDWEGAGLVRVEGGV